MQVDPEKTLAVTAYPYSNQRQDATAVPGISGVVPQIHLTFC